MLLRNKNKKKAEKFEYEGHSDSIIKIGVIFEYLPVVIMSLIAGVLVIGGIVFLFFADCFFNLNSGEIKTEWIEAYNVPIGLSLCILAIFVIYFCVKTYKNISIKIKHKR